MEGMDCCPSLPVSTRIQLNGNQGDRICHVRGLRQGDLLSPMLFLLVMEVLNSLFRKADHWALLQKLPPRHILFRVSIVTSHP
jgi:hypothetical protein